MFQVHHLPTNRVGISWANRWWCEQTFIYIFTLCIHRWTSATGAESYMAAKFNQSNMITQCMSRSISLLWTHSNCNPMCHTWEPAVFLFVSGKKPTFKSINFWVTKANSFCESIHARGQSHQAMHDYKKSQAINIYVQSYRGIKKIYSHAGQYAKITYKMSLSLSKIVFIQGFFSNIGTNVYILFKIDKIPITSSIR